MKSTWQTRMVLSALLLLVATAAAAQTPAQLTVRGEAQLQVAADEAQMQIAVLSRERLAEQALEENSARLRQVEAALRKAGLDEGEYRTGRFRIEPVWSRRPKSAPDDWQPQVIGYSVRNSLHVETQKLVQVGELIEAAIGAGADSIEGLQFGLASPQVHRADAIASAVAHAQSDARALAEAASLRLVRLISLNLDNALIALPTPRMAVMAETMALKAPPPVIPGEVPVRATVTLSYEVAP